MTKCYALSVSKIGRPKNSGLSCDCNKNTCRICYQRKLQRKSRLRRSPLKRSTKPIARKVAPKKKRAGPPRRVAVARDRKYLYEIAMNYCTVGMLHGSEGCSMVTDPAHGPVNGAASKGSDYEAIPLCRTHH